MNTTNRIGIVGGGLGGLAAACTLAARGHRVVLFEKNAWVGGKAAITGQNGFRFDMGPTILTLPSVLRRIFSEADHSLERWLSLVRLDPQWRSFFTDGTTLDLVADPERMSQIIGQFSPDTGSQQGFLRFMELARRLNSISSRYFFWRPVGGMRDMFDLSGFLRPQFLRDILSMRPASTVAATIREHVPDARVAQMLDHFTQYVGSAPDTSPSVLCGIAHMQSDEGVWYPVGGIRAVAKALEELARSLRVEIHTGTGIRRIVVEGDRVRGVETDGGVQFNLSYVLANSDVVRTHRELLGDSGTQGFLNRRKYEPACSGVVLYLGLRQRYEHLLHHNFIFSQSPEAEFESIYRQGEPAADPTCYVCAPSITDPTVAPPGGEALYVLVHTPYLRQHHDWNRMLPDYRKVILNKLAQAGGMPDIESRIVTESALTPQDIHDRYRVLNGAIYGLASHGRLFGAFKPSNRSPDVRGLYFGGGSAHPGPGMPMALMSGWIAADALHSDMTGRRNEHVSAGEPLMVAGVS